MYEDARSARHADLAFAGARGVGIQITPVFTVVFQDRDGIFEDLPLARAANRLWGVVGLPRCVGGVSL